MIWVFFLPWCPLGIYREALPLENTPPWSPGSEGFGWGPDHMSGVSLHRGASQPSWVSLVLAPFSVSWDFLPKIRQDPGFHRAALVLSIQHPEESMWMASKNYSVPPVMWDCINQICRYKKTEGRTRGCTKDTLAGLRMEQKSPDTLKKILALAGIRI